MTKEKKQKQTEQTGFQAGFDPEAYKQAIAGVDKKYKCAANFFHQNLLFSPTPGIPYSAARIQLLQDRYFKEPSAFPFDLLVAVEDESYDPMEHKGAWRTCQPEEMRMAFIFAVAGDVKQVPDPPGPAATARRTGRLQAWKHHALTCTAEFRLLEGDEA